MSTTEPAPTTRVFIPGPYLNAYRAEPRPDNVPDALHALLTEGDISGEPSEHLAALDVPDALLPALAAVTYAHHSAWSDEHEPTEERAMLARAALLVHGQAKYPSATTAHTDQERP